MVQNVEQIPLDFGEQPDKPRHFKVIKGEKTEKKKLTPEEKKNIQWFWRVWEYKKEPDAVLGKLPYLVEHDDPRAQVALEWQHIREAEKYEGKPHFELENVKKEIILKDIKSVPVGRFYPNLKPIPEDAGLLLIEDPKSKQLIWFFAELKGKDLIELREFPADFVTEFSKRFPVEIKQAIIEAEQQVNE